MYLDPEEKAIKAYGISCIPTLVVIDREGSVASYLIGLQDESVVLSALKKAGLTME